MQIEKEIREFLCAYEIKLIMSHRSLTIGKLFPYKDCQSLLHSSGVVYQLTCSCGQNYIGQTKQNLITRLNEYRMCEDSEVCKHLLNNPNHKINFDSPKKLWTEVIRWLNYASKKPYVFPKQNRNWMSAINLCPCIFFIVLNCCLKMTPLFGCVFLSV